MVDITMCRNHDCPLIGRCYRYTAQPSINQSYAVFEFIYNYHADITSCDYHIPLIDEGEFEDDV
jgi:hypothetical protein